MVVSVKPEEQVASGISACEPDHQLDSLCSREQIAHLLGRGNVLDKLFREIDFQWAAARRIQVVKRVHLALDRFQQFRMPVAEHARSQARHVVQVFVAVGVPQMCALSSHYEDGLE